MGANASHQLEKELVSSNESVPVNEHYFGLVNFGNTCYCNSVIQALYFCRPFRERVLQYKQQLKKTGSQRENLLTCLADLFHNIAMQKRKVGTIAPKKFVGRLKKENEVFDNYLQQDAHEFLNYLLNTIADILVDEKRTERTPSSCATTAVSGNNTSTGSGISNLLSVKSSSSTASTKLAAGGGSQNLVSPTSVNSSIASSAGGTGGAGEEPAAGIGGVVPGIRPTVGGGLPPTSSGATWVHDIFQGKLTNETRCLNCEVVSSKDEDFLDLSVDVEQNTSISHCLNVFSNTETLCTDQKYYCDNCCSKQEAQKRMRVKKLPLILALHLKRFKYVEHLNRFTKLSYRVVFPLELRIFNTSDDALNPERLYDLVAVVIHCGSTPNRGHYICIVKSHNFWLLFDDDAVEKIDLANIEEFYGLSEGGVQKNSETGYILFYQARDT